MSKGQKRNQTEGEESSNPENSISAEAAEAIGRFVIVWGSLEHELEGIITAMFRVVPVLRPCLTSGLTLDPKIEMVRSGIGIGDGALLKPEEATRFHKILNGVRDLTAEYRNFVFHWIVTDSPAGDSLIAAKLKRGKRPVMTMLKVNARYFEEVVAKVASARNQLREMRTRIDEAYSEIDSAHLRRYPDDALKAELSRRRSRPAPRKPADRSVKPSSNSKKR